jgi:3-oxoacyl-[acyl-carrier protein] reductase
LSNILSGKVALVTGSSRGIGRHIAIEMAKEGASIAINYLKDDNGAKETLELLNNEGIYAKAYKVDIRNFNDAKAMVEDVVNHFGKIDILVNNAGISKIGLFMDQCELDYNETFNSNFKSVFNCTNAAVRYMIERKTGCIINISSIWGNVGASCEVLYSASKGAINSFTKALGKELAPSNIRVNAISPGVIDTKMNSMFSEENIKNMEEEIPMMRFGRSDEIGKLAAFLASDNASYITSQIITADGGMI